MPFWSRAKISVTYYESREVLRLFGAAGAGDSMAAEKLRRIEAPFATSSDWSEMILVQMKHSTIDSAGRVRLLNKAPARDDRAHRCVDIFTRSSNGTAWQFVPLPSGFPVHQVTYRDGTFVFETADGRSVAGTLAQILQAMRPVQFALEGVTEKQLESSFNSIPAQVPPQPKAHKTAAENPPIPDETIGTFVFDERVQWFIAEHPRATRLARLYIKTADRDQAIQLLEIARKLIQDLDDFDGRCKDFAVRSLLDLKNGAWLRAGERSMSKDQFTRSISLESISIDTEGGVTADYGDGGIFWGHTVVVELDAEGAPLTADLAG